MPLQITGRHTEVSQSDRDYLERKMPRIRRLFDRIDEMSVVFIAEKLEHLVEINFRAGHIHAFAKGSGATPMAAIDKAVDKLLAKIAKERDKKFGNKMHQGDTIRQAEPGLDEAPEEESA
jgi:ribosomal subunit interface protein